MLQMHQLWGSINETELEKLKNGQARGKYLENLKSHTPSW